MLLYWTERIIFMTATDMMIHSSIFLHSRPARARFRFVCIFLHSRPATKIVAFTFAQMHHFSYTILEQRDSSRHFCPKNQHESLRPSSYQCRYYPT